MISAGLRLTCSSLVSRSSASSLACGNMSASGLACRCKVQGQTRNIPRFRVHLQRAVRDALQAQQHQLVGKTAQATLPTAARKPCALPASRCSSPSWSQQRGSGWRPGPLGWADLQESVPHAHEAPHQQPMSTGRQTTTLHQAWRVLAWVQTTAVHMRRSTDVCASKEDESGRAHAAPAQPSPVSSMMRSSWFMVLLPGKMGLPFSSSPKMQPAVQPQRARGRI